MRRAAALAFAALWLAACTTPAPRAPNPNAPEDRSGRWAYVTGPHGENCLMYWRDLGTNAGVLAMSCDTVKP